MASDEINYRRFFDINELAALSMERPEVFEATHELIFRLLREGKIDGLRIDHPDGLYDPQQYLERLQRHYVLELARGPSTADAGRHGAEWEEVREAACASDLPASRPGQSACGGRCTSWWRRSSARRAAAGRLADLRHQRLRVPQRRQRPVRRPGNAKAFTRLYHDWIEVDPALRGDGLPEEDADPAVVAVQRAADAGLPARPAGAEEPLVARLHAQQPAPRPARGHRLLPRLPLLHHGRGVREPTAATSIAAVRRATRRNPAITAALFHFVRDMLLLHYPEPVDRGGQAEQRRFVGKFQQVTAPVMAKGVEDTAFYIYNRLLSLNEVGGDPDRSACRRPSVHRFLPGPAGDWPWSLSPLSTHDTKRSEDVRARLNVLSEMPGEWQAASEPLAASSTSRTASRPRTSWPPTPTKSTALPDPARRLAAGAVHGARTTPTFVARIQAYMKKALHEAKVHTSWINPNAAYDEAVRSSSPASSTRPQPAVPRRFPRVSAADQPFRLVQLRCPRRC